MPLKQNELNRQLSQADKELAEWSDILKERGVSDGQFRRDPVWRSLNAQHKRLSRRMRTAVGIVARDEEVKQRKAEKAQAAAAPAEKKSKSKKKKGESQKGDKKEPKKKAAKSEKGGTKDKKPAKKKAKK